MIAIQPSPTVNRMKCACMRQLLCLALLVGLLGTVSLARAQEFSESVARVGEEYARGYVAPLVDVIGANFNSGLVPAVSLGSRTNEVNVYFGIKAFGAFVPASDRRFDASFVNDVPLSHRLGSEIIEMNVPANVTVEQAPTFFGESEPGEMTIRIDQDTTFTYLGLILPVAFDTTFTLEGIGGIWDHGTAPFLVPEVVMGTLLGTSIMVRWVPEISVQNSESIGLFGFGVQHRLNPYLPTLPFDLGVQAVWQRAGADDDQDQQVVRISTFAANVHAGKRFGPIGVYGALQSEQSTVKVRYEYTPTGFDRDAEPIPVRLNMAGVNKMRIILGSDLKLGPVHANADFSVGRMNTISVGLGFAY